MHHRIQRDSNLKLGRTVRTKTERGAEGRKKRSGHDVHLMSGSHRSRLPVMRCTSDRGKGIAKTSNRDKKKNT